MSEVNKQRLKEYQISYRNAEKKQKSFDFFSLRGIKINKKSWFLVNNILLKINFIYEQNQLILMK